jgi:hypothetical protein
LIAAFVSWVVYVLLLLVRRTPGLRGRKAAYLSGAVFAVMMVVWPPTCSATSQVRCPMTLSLIGVNHKTAPIELRERIAISREDLPETTRALAAVPGVSECMIVSTCNRVELLAAVDSPDDDGLTGFLHQHFGLDPALLAPHIYEHRDRRRCGICSAWPPAWTRWWWASRRFWAR